MRRLSIALVVVLAALAGAWSPGQLDTATPLHGRLAFGSVTGTSAGTANTIITTTGRRRVVICTNNLNADMVLTYNGADWAFLPSAVGIAIDLGASGLTLADNKAIGVYRSSGAATAGSVGCTAH